MCLLCAVSTNWLFLPSAVTIFVSRFAPRFVYRIFLVTTVVAIVNFIVSGVLFALVPNKNVCPGVFRLGFGTDIRGYL